MLTAMLVALSLGAAPQAPPPPPPPPMQGPVRDPGRRPPPEPIGTAIIRGRVIAADTGTPVRHASVNLAPIAPPPPAVPPGATPPGATASSQTVTINGVTTFVNLTGSGMGRPRSATTDAQGAFEFKELPAGSYRLMASPGSYAAAYLPMAFGAKKPNGPGSSDPGTPIDLADGQVFDKATVALTRGAVIVGRVTDENGEPLARVQVYTMAYQPGMSRGMRAGAGAQTDDLGQFRLFGLAPGEYTVAAEARGNTFVPPNAPPETEEDKQGFLTTYFPGTPDEGSAQRVRAKAGAETPGVEIHMVSGRLFHITGVVSDSQGRPSGRTSGSLFRRTGNGFTSSIGFSTDEQGRFQMRNVPPGNYRLTVRQPPIGPRNPDGTLIDPGEFATLAITVSSDIDNLFVSTSQGATITGNLVFENGPPQTQGGQQLPPIRVMAASGDPDGMLGAPTPQPAQVTPDLTFTMKGLAGEFLLRTGAPGGNVLKSVTLNGDEIADTPREFKNGDRVTLVLTSRAAMLEGNVTDAAGKPVTGATMLLFSDDKASWRTNSLRTRRAGVDPAGHYRIPGVLAGRYLLVALPRERANLLAFATDPALYEMLAKEATTLVVGEDEQRQVDVKVSSGSGGE